MFSRIRIRVWAHQLPYIYPTTHWRLRSVPLRRGLASTPRFFEQDVSSDTATPPLKSPGAVREEEDLSWVPGYCPGCGAPSQRQDPNLPGHYSRLTRRQRFGDLTIKSQKQHSEENIFHGTLERLRSQSGPETQSPELREFLAAAPASSPPPTSVNVAPAEAGLICGRCRGIRYHHRGSELPAYPTLRTLTNLIQNSPHTRNHIYHLIDAADLPMSLQPELREHLYKNLPLPLRRGLTISYVVTRADILMASSQQVWSLTTYIKKRIKDALPEDEKIEDVMNRTHIISTRNGWGVGRVKDEIRIRTGGVWIIGGVNVGKSRFVMEMWPEGGESRPVTREEAAEYEILPEDDGGTEVKAGGEGVEREKEEEAYDHPLYPQYVAPTVSDMPGTTAAPIKIAYRVSSRGGRKWGEMIDLPGFERWVSYSKNGLLKYVRPELRAAVAMNKRVKGQQYTIKAGQSLILGGLILITPRISGRGGQVVLATPFTNLPAHIASTYKSLKWLEHPEPESVDHLYYPAPTTVPLPESLIPQKPPKRSEPSTASPPPAGLPLPHHHKITSAEDYKGTPPRPQEHLIPPLLPPHFASAGVVEITEDVTLRRNPFLSMSELESLPYIILGRDLLLEGIGWVELNVQMSKNQHFRTDGVVEVEVFTPEGRGAGSRTSMGAAMMRKEMEKVQARSGVRQRKAMKGEKKKAKVGAMKGEKKAKMGGRGR
ncbi:unnamed protein product [Tuber aestivum]|uniref:Genetic interactor of prohibitins 3, mitochondrial n=1 Tax=Tuber aestivum TaxID=59557 RepID=A0A292PSV7_9PEZI|nr:unnamed protein product [Tuber aestivum]